MIIYSQQPIQVTLPNAHKVKHSASYKETKQNLYKLPLLGQLLPSTTSTAGEAIYAKRRIVLNTESLQLYFLVTSGKLVKFRLDIKDHYAFKLSN